MIIAGTGHRPNKTGRYTTESSNRLIKLATEWLEEHKPSRVISGMALGWDQALGWAAVDLSIPLTAAIPFEGQETMWPAESRRKWANLLSLADQVEIVCEGAYSPAKMQLRNEWMVDNADKVLALWDGTSGGTANCIGYAQYKEVEIVNLWAKFARLYR